MAYIAVPLKLSKQNVWFVYNTAGRIVAAHLTQRRAVTLANTLNVVLRAARRAREQRGTQEGGPLA
jgi:hypothetical protein